MKLVVSRISCQLLEDFKKLPETVVVSKHELTVDRRVSEVLTISVSRGEGGAAAAEGRAQGPGDHRRWTMGSVAEFFRDVSHDKFLSPGRSAQGRSSTLVSCSLVSSISLVLCMEPAFVVRLKLKLILNFRKAWIYLHKGRIWVPGTIRK